MRVEPALEQLDAYLDQALLASPQAGAGRSTATAPAACAQAVREHLRGHRGVADVRAGAPNEGGDGATVVTFRGA